ncbi:hypothetical protein GGR75_002157 [Xanthomonas campestris]|nr:hypothetical protein [Xanthomonas campestris]
MSWACCSSCRQRCRCPRSRWHVGATISLPHATRWSCRSCCRCCYWYCSWTIAKCWATRMRWSASSWYWCLPWRCLACLARPGLAPRTPHRGRQARHQLELGRCAGDGATGISGVAARGRRCTAGHPAPRRLACVGRVAAPVLRPCGEPHLQRAVSTAAPADDRQDHSCRDRGRYPSAADLAEYFPVAQPAVTRHVPACADTGGRLPVGPLRLRLPG